MKNGSPYDFLESLSMQEEGIEYNNRCYFFHGFQYNSKKKKYEFRIEEWDKKGEYIQDICTLEANTSEEIHKIAIENPIIDGKTFWELEPYMTWVDWGIWC